MKIDASLALCLFICLLAASAAVSDDKPTGLSDAQSAIDANLRTSEGKAFDEKIGEDFVAKHLDAVRQCKSSADGDMRNFWILLKLDKNGAAKEVLFHPSTKLGTCSRTALLKETFLAPPRDSYWVGIYMNLSH
jgi:hypothetical protein